MSLEIIKFGGSKKENVLDGVKLLSDPRISPVQRLNLIKEATCQIVDQFDQGSKTPKERRASVNNLKMMIKIDEASRNTEVVCASGLMATLVNLAYSERDEDIRRFAILNDLITAEMGFKSLMMVDCEWCKDKRLASYIGQVINKINRIARFTWKRSWRESDLGNQEHNFYEDLDKLLTVVSDRNGTEGDEDLAINIFLALNMKEGEKEDESLRDDNELSFKMSFIVGMARHDWLGAVAFLESLDKADLIDDEEERVDMVIDENGDWGSDDE